MVKVPCLHFTVNGYLGSFQFGTILNQVAVYVLVHVCLQACQHSGWHISSGGIAGS